MGEQLKVGSEIGSLAARVWLAHVTDQLAWEVRRFARGFFRRFGLFGWLLPIGALLGAGAWVVECEQVQQLLAIQSRLIEQKSSPAQPIVFHEMDGRSRLKAFEDYLLPHEDIPGVVQNLLNLAEDEHLSIQHGEYQAQIDAQGVFLRYRMSLPVKGNAQAIYRFMQSALNAQKTLALESVQFKRERIESADIEARIQWVMFTRLSGNRIAPAVAGVVAPTIAPGDRS